MIWGVANILLKNFVNSQSFFFLTARTPRIPKSSAGECPDDCEIWRLQSYSATISNHEVHAVGWKGEENELYVATCGSTAMLDNTTIRVFSNSDSNAMNVPRPCVVAQYHNGAGIIDVHDELRQGYLHWERSYATHSGFFRLFTTITAMVVTDAMKVCSTLQPNLFRDYGIVDFAGELARAMLNDVVEVEQPSFGLHTSSFCELHTYPQIPSISHPNTTHSPEYYCAMCSPRGSGNRHRTSFYCTKHHVPLCSPLNSNQRQCFAQHIFASLTEVSSVPPKKPRFDK
jgi:hypothetical protein